MHTFLAWNHVMRYDIFDCSRGWCVEIGRKREALNEVFFVSDYSPKRCRDGWLPGASQRASENTTGLIIDPVAITGRGRGGRKKTIPVL